MRENKYIRQHFSEVRLVKAFPNFMLLYIPPMIKTILQKKKKIYIYIYIDITSYTELKHSLIGAEKYKYAFVNTSTNDETAFTGSKIVVTQV